MNTKIIYISGSEVFEMADIRAAFDTVRTMLGLSPDTVLFGVPVDADSSVSANDAAPVVDGAPVVAPVADAAPEIPDDVQIDAEPMAPEMPVVETVNLVEPIESVESDVDPEPVDSVPSVDEVPEKVIPILSVLSVNDVVVPETAPDDIEISEPEISDISTIVPDIPDTVQITPVSVAPVGPDDEIPAPVDAIDDITVAPDVPEISEIPEIPTPAMLNEEMPAAPVEKTLEHLLESTTPLREDLIPDVPDVIPEPDIDIFSDPDTDSTLAQLASEFVKKEDSITDSTPSQSHGKIEKLKQMLPLRPFSRKQNREDTGLMGDLFNWAGVAANDDDFSMPGFFTNAASKK